MAPRGSSKFLSIKHEDRIAWLFNGKRSKSSGAAEHDAGDVRTDHLLIECKMTKTKVPRFVHQLEKIALEAWEEGRDPMLALRYYDPTSPLADGDGWIDITIMRSTDHATREHTYRPLDRQSVSPWDPA